RLSLPESWLWLNYANGVVEGHGVLLGARYFEVVPDPANEDQTLRLATFSFLEPTKVPTSVPVPKLTGCSEYYLAGREKVLIVGCVREADPDTNPHTVLQLSRTDDYGANWSDQGIVDW